MTQQETSLEPKSETTDGQDVAASTRPKKGLTPEGRRGVQGLDGGSTQQSPVSQDDTSPSEDIPEKGAAPLSPETKLELNRIQSLPLEKRKEEMAKFFQSLQDPLGNSSQELGYLQLDTEILRDGKGIKIRDENGTVYQIDYE